MSLRKKLNQIGITSISWMQWMRKLEFWAFKSMHSPGGSILFGLTQVNLTCDHIALKDKSNNRAWRFSELTEKISSGYNCQERELTSDLFASIFHLSDNSPYLSITLWEMGRGRWQDGSGGRSWERVILSEFLLWGKPPKFRNTKKVLHLAKSLF